MINKKIYIDFIRRNIVNKRSSLLYRSIATKPREYINRNVILLTLEKYKVNSVKDWPNVRKAVLEHELNRGQFTNHSIDAMILEHCLKTNRFDLAGSYITYLDQENIKPNRATIGKYLKFMYLKNQESCIETGETCDKNDENLIIKHYEELRKDYPVLDCITLENAVTALSVTTRWKECLDLLKEIKISALPSVPCYSAIIVSSFLYKEEDLGWRLLEEMLDYEKTPLGIIYLAYIKSIQRLGTKEDVDKKLEKLFLFFQENDLKPTEEVILSVSALGKKLGYKDKLTTVTYKGICSSCSKKLNHFELTNEEFSELKEKVFQNVIVGRDVFVKTTPEELERFKKFVGSMGQFDVVLDGLNVAYTSGTKHPPHVLSSFVASVVSHFRKQRKKVLVLGRVHMKRWPSSSWNYVTHNASVFLAQNISQDDPYLLYCALSSGKDTIIVTRDLMRSHKFLLKEPRLKMLFNRWLSQRQWQVLRVDERKGPFFIIPPPFSVTAQCNQGTWHVPYETNDPIEKNEFHRTWLCLKR